MVGQSTLKEHTMAKKAKSQNPADKQAPLSGKVENDYNQQGEQVPTQKNEGRRTPESRHDRESKIGNNQAKQRGSAPDSGAGGKGR
jgi:hypothetical protein